MIQWRETCCKCKCGLNVTSKFFDLINEFRDDFGKPMIILSGARCEQRNKEVGGAKNSAHVDGRAVDVERTPALEKFCTEANLERFGLYMEDLAFTKSWIHLTDRAPASGKRMFKP